MKVGISMSLNALSIPTCGDALYVISFLKGFDDGMELLVDERGIPRKIGATVAAPIKFHDDGTDLVRRLATIERIAKVAFPLRRLRGISKQEIDNVIMLSALLANESMTMPMTLSATPAPGSAFTPDGQFVRIDSPEKMQFQILGHQIPWSEGVIAEGRCERSEQVTDKDGVSVQMYVPRCRVRTSKNGKALSPTDEP